MPFQDSAGKNMNEFDYRKYPNKLNLGCGFDKRPGYTNVDMNSFHAPDLVCDVLDLNVLPKNYYVEIVAQDILEHLPRNLTKSALVHWASFLHTGGNLVLRVPNVLGLLKLLSARQNQTLERHEAFIQDLFGTQAYSGDFHYTSFTEIILRSYLVECGFVVMEIKDVDGWLFDVSARKDRVVSPEEIGDFSDLLRQDFSNLEFVKAAYLKILNREPDLEGLNFYVSNLDEKKRSRDQLLYDLCNSAERSPQTSRSQLVPRSLIGKMKDVFLGHT
jgi:predicted SAM-dependent methyltransferase